MSDADVSISYQSLDSLKLHEVFLNYYNKQIFTDVEFLVKCGEDFVAYKAHRLPLAVFSPVFEDMFYGSTQGYSTPVTIDDVTPNVFIVMLKFMYGSVCDLRSRERDVNFLLKLYRAATQYQIEALICHCRSKLKKMTPDKHNVFHLLDASRMTNAEGIASKCMKVLESRTGEVLASQEDLGDVSHANLITILTLEKVSFGSEFDLVSRMFSWAKREHLRLMNKQEKKSFRDVLDSLLGYVDLIAMEPVEFGLLLKNYPGVFSESEICKIFRNIVDAGCCDLPKWANAGIRRIYNYDGRD